MLKRGDIVFIDTNAIVAAHKVKAWNAIRNAFKLVTAKICTEESTQPNKYGSTLVNRTAEEVAGELEVRNVDDGMRFALLGKMADQVDLDPGELDLLSLTLAQGNGAWCLCGPDKATLRALYVLGWSDRMVALEEMMSQVGIASNSLDRSLTKRWLEEKRTQLKLEGIGM